MAQNGFARMQHKQGNLYHFVCQQLICIDPCILYVDPTLLLEDHAMWCLSCFKHKVASRTPHGCLILARRAATRYLDTTVQSCSSWRPARRIIHTTLSFSLSGDYKIHIVRRFGLHIMYGTRSNTPDNATVCLAWATSTTKRNHDISIKSALYQWLPRINFLSFAISRSLITWP